MKLEIMAESNISDALILAVEMVSKNGRHFDLEWDECEFATEGGHFSIRCKGVYFDCKYANGRISELDGAKVNYVYVSSPSESTGLLKLKEMSFEDGENSLVLNEACLGEMTYRIIFG